MMERPSCLCGFLVTAMFASLFAGCGSEGSTAREDILNTPREELVGASTKGMLYEFRAKVRKHGVEGARQALPELLENFQGYEEQPVGDHLETYRQIAEKLKSLETSLAGSPGKDQVVQAAEELGTLADKLPGKADQNPQVE